MGSRATQGQRKYLRYWLLVLVGGAHLAMGRGAEADMLYGATAMVQLGTGAGPYDGTWTDQHALIAEESRFATNSNSSSGYLAQTNSDATATVNATAADPVSHYNIIDFAGQSHTVNTGGLYEGTAVADMKFTDVVSLRPYTDITPDPKYAPGAQNTLYFNTVVEGNITNLTFDFKSPFFANSLVRITMNTGQHTDLSASTSPANSNIPNFTQLSSSNWDTINIMDNGDFLGTKRFSVPYSSLSQGYPFALEEILSTQADDGGLADISGLHSVHLVGITYADGTTPESHGYQIENLTGFPSPNLPASVPEPSSLQLAVLGLVLLVGGRAGGRGKTHPLPQARRSLRRGGQSPPS